VLACLARPARCGTPVPQPLNVMNNVKAKNLKRFVAGEGVSKVQSKGVLCRHFLCS